MSWRPHLQQLKLLYLLDILAHEDKVNTTEPKLRYGKEYVHHNAGEEEGGGGGDEGRGEREVGRGVGGREEEERRRRGEEM